MMSFFRTIKGAKADSSPAASSCSDSSDPLSSVFAEMHPGKAGSISERRAHRILHINGPADIAQIGEPVIALVAVDMVDFLGGPIAGNVEPSQPAKGALRTVHVSDKIAFAVAGADNIANMVPPPVVGKARKNASPRIIMQKLAQTFSGKLGHLASVSARLLEGWPEGDEPTFRPLKLGQSVNSILA